MFTAGAVAGMTAVTRRPSCAPWEAGPSAGLPAEAAATTRARCAAFQPEPRARQLPEARDVGAGQDTQSGREATTGGDDLGVARGREFGAVHGRKSISENKKPRAVTPRAATRG